LTIGPSLPDVGDDRFANVVVHRHVKTGELHWALEIGPAPSSEPPQRVREHNEKIGGRKGLSALLREPLALDGPALASFRARYLVPGAELRCRVIPAAVESGGQHEVALRIGTARFEQVGYRFDAGASGIEEISIIYLHKSNEFALSIAANGPLKLTSDRWVPFADDILDIAAGTFFVPAGGGS
jgi:hypothetical protein